MLPEFSCRHKLDKLWIFLSKSVLRLKLNCIFSRLFAYEKLVKAFQDATAVVDSAGICCFTTFAWTMEDIAPQIDAACEGDWSVDRCLEVGERIWTMERDFNLAAGLTGKDDTLPKRLLKDAAKTGPAKGRVNDLDQMLPHYYEIRGWTPEGVPTTETRTRLGLDPAGISA